MHSKHVVHYGFASIAQKRKIERERDWPIGAELEHAEKHECMRTITIFCIRYMNIAPTNDHFNKLHLIVIV